MGDVLLWSDLGPADVLVLHQQGGYEADLCELGRIAECLVLCLRKAEYFDVGAIADCVFAHALVVLTFLCAGQGKPAGLAPVG